MQSSTDYLRRLDWRNQGRDHLPDSLWSMTALEVLALSLAAQRVAPDRPTERPARTLPAMSCWPSSATMRPLYQFVMLHGILAKISLQERTHLMGLLHVLFEIPAHLQTGLSSGVLERVGGVIRDAASKQVVAWLRDGVTTQPHWGVSKLKEVAHAF